MLGHIGGDHGQNIIQHGDQLGHTDTAIVFDELAQHHSLPVGAVEVASCIATVSGIPQSLLTGQIVQTGSELAATFQIDELRFLTVQLDLNAAKHAGLYRGCA